MIVDSVEAARIVRDRCIEAFDAINDIACHRTMGSSLSHKEGGYCVEGREEHVERNWGTCDLVNCCTR